MQMAVSSRGTLTWSTVSHDRRLSSCVVAVRIEMPTEVTPELVEALGRLVLQLNPNLATPTAEHLRLLLKDPGATLLIARDGNEIVGTAMVIVYPTTLRFESRIEDVVVDESARGRGVGEALVRECIELATGCEQPDVVAFEVAGVILVLNLGAVRETEQTCVARRVERDDLGRKDVEVCEQPGYRERCRACQNFRWSSCLDNATGLEDEHAISEFQTLFEAVSNQNNRCLELTSDLSQNFIETASERSVETLCRFVQQEDSGLRDKCACDRAALFLPAADFMRTTAADAVQFELGEHICDAARSIEAGQVRDPEKEVIPNGHVRK